MASDDSSPSDAPAPKRRRDGDAKTRRGKKGMGAVGLFLLFGAAPVGLVVWYLAQPDGRQQQILDKVPEGAGGRAIKAGICVAVLIGLARVALPAFHGAAGTLYDGMQWVRTRPKGLRIVLFPVELILWLLWFTVQMLVAVDAVMIIAACLAFLLLVARIFKPDLMPDVLPELLR